MKHYLSYGGGVNSTALLLFMLDRPDEFPPFESVFVDHGGDYPETYAYVFDVLQPWLAEHGHAPVTILKPFVEKRFESLYQQCMERGIIPLRMSRFCTSDWKVKPLDAYYQKPAVRYSGIHAGEERRAIPSNVVDIRAEYPLVERGIDQADCERIILEHDLPVPPKSGCFFCPFMPRAEVIKLALRDDGLFCKAKAMEENAVAHRLAKGRAPFYLWRVPIDQMIDPHYRPGQESLWEEARPCGCGL